MSCCLSKQPLVRSSDGAKKTANGRATRGRFESAVSHSAFPFSQVSRLQSALVMFLSRYFLIRALTLLSPSLCLFGTLVVLPVQVVSLCVTCALGNWVTVVSTVNFSLTLTYSFASRGRPVPGLHAILFFPLTVVSFIFSYLPLFLV